MPATKATLGRYSMREGATVLAARAALALTALLLITLAGHIDWCLYGGAGLLTGLFLVYIVDRRLVGALSWALVGIFGAALIAQVAAIGYLALGALAVARIDMSIAMVGRHQV